MIGSECCEAIALFFQSVWIPVLLTLIAAPPVLYPDVMKTIEPETVGVEAFTL
jgi:hypothetical protein